MKPAKTKANYLYTKTPAKGLLDVPRALNRQLVLWGNPPDYRVPRSIKGGSY